MEITLKLSEDEAKALLGLMDLGVKAGGIAVAEAGAVLHNKLQFAHRQAKEQAKSPCPEISATESK